MISLMMPFRVCRYVMGYLMKFNNYSKYNNNIIYQNNKPSPDIIQFLDFEYCEIQHPMQWCEKNIKS